MRLIENFQPPDGTRLIWHGLKDKQLWEPRINQISNGQQERERRSVLLGIRKLTLQPISKGFEYERTAEWARNHGLAIMPVRAVGRFDGFAHRYTPGEDMYVTAIASKPEYAESSEPELYLGFPECCQRFFAANFPKYIDPIWQWAQSGILCDDSWQEGDIENQMNGVVSSNQSYVVAHPYSNPLLRYWSLRFVPHIPCSPQCEESITLGTQFAELMTMEERDWLWELLSSPIEWTCLHGVAEIKTKWFRIVVGSNPSAEKFTVRSACA